MAGTGKNRYKYREIMAKAVYIFIQGFKTVFQMHGAVCKFEPSCSKYAQEAIRVLPLPIAVAKIFWRVLRCNPLSRGGFEPVTKEPNNTLTKQ